MESFKSNYLGMKTLKKIKLNQLCKDELILKKDEMSVLGGAMATSSGVCVCVCIESAYPTANYPTKDYSNKAV